MRREPYDLIIRGASVIDGTGGPRYAADIALRAGRQLRRRSKGA